MQFQQVIYKRASSPLFTKTELEASLKRSRATKSSIGNLLSRAVERDDLIRLKSGIYCLPKKYRSRLISPFEFLNKIDPLAYVSDLTALSHLDLIPEAVGLITAYSAKKISGQKPFHTDIGAFQFLKVPPHILTFGVDTVNLKGGISYRMATPLKAILDHAFSTQKSWKSKEALFHDLRLDEESLNQINWNDLEEYKAKYNNLFISQLCENLSE